MNTDNPLQSLLLLTQLPSGGGEGLFGKQIKPLTLVTYEVRTASDLNNPACITPRDNCIFK